VSAGGGLPRIGFLFYDARSGSTFLSRLLHASPDVVVTLESRLLCDLLLHGQTATTTAADTKAALDMIFAEKKVADWGISREAFAERLAQLGHRADAGVILATAADLYRRSVKPDATLVLVKHGNHLFYLDQIKGLLPEAAFVHIVRDGRDVFLSKREALHSETGRPMMTSLVQAALLWRRYARSYLRGAGVHRIRYEELVAEPRATADRLLEALGATCGIAGGEDGADYARLIPGSQEHLHTNVTRSAMLDNTERWRSALAPAESVLYQLLAGRELEALGYALDERRLRWRDRGRFVAVCFREFYLVILRKLWRALLPGSFYRWRRAREIFRLR
jgi:hypothetical protein